MRCLSVNRLCVPPIKGGSILAASSSRQQFTWASPLYVDCDNQTTPVSYAPTNYPTRIDLYTILSPSTLCVHPAAANISTVESQGCSHEAGRQKNGADDSKIQTAAEETADH